MVKFLSSLLWTPKSLLDTPVGTSPRKTNTIKTDFADARMNFPHWVLTKTPLKPDGLQSLLHTPVHAQAAMQLSPNDYRLSRKAFGAIEPEEVDGHDDPS